MRKRLISAAVILLLGFQSVTQATTIVAVRHGNLVVVAADSGMTNGLGQTGVVKRCKVQTFGGRLLVGVSGDVGAGGPESFELYAIVEASVHVKTNSLDIERVVREASPAWRTLVVLTKRRHPETYPRTYRLSRDGGFERGIIAELLVVTAGKPVPAVRTAAIEFVLPTASLDTSEVRFSPKVRSCPDKCHEGDWLAAIGTVQVTFPDNRTAWRMVPDSASMQKQRTPTDPSKIAFAAVKGMVGPSKGQVAPPIHLFEVGTGIRNLTEIEPCP